MGYRQDMTWENAKLAIMLLACVFAVYAQFMPTPFPENRVILGVCCAFYAILSAAHQVIVWLIEKDTVFIVSLG